MTGRLAFCTRPALGHPMMPLALAARRAGHEVAFLAGRGVVDRLRALGFETWQAGQGHDFVFATDADLVAPSGIRELEKLGRAASDASREVGRARSLAPHGQPALGLVKEQFVGAMVDKAAQTMVPLLERLSPDLVVYEQFDFGTPVAAGRLGLPAVRFALVRGQRGGNVPPTQADRFLDGYPPRLQDPSTFDSPLRVPVGPVAWSEPIGAMPAVPGPRPRPPVYLTLGTVPFQSGEHLRAAVDGLSTVDVDVLVALGPHDPAVLGPARDNVRVERFVRQAELLPNVDLVVHQGGTGTFVAAMAEGLPQLIVAQGADNFVNTEVAVSAGLGIALEPDGMTPASVAEAARALLTDGRFRAAAAPVRAEIAAMPHSADVLPGLLDAAVEAGP